MTRRARWAVALRIRALPANLTRRAIAQWPDDLGVARETVYQGPTGRAVARGNSQITSRQIERADQ